MASYKAHFSRFLAADPERLHFAAHSHHYWPDASLDGQQRAWEWAAAHADAKWGPIFEEVLPAAQAHVARMLGLPDPSTIAFAPNTHELLVRIASSIEAPHREGRPLRILSTDAEFHSFERQSRRWEEAGLAAVERVPAAPFESFPERLCERAAAGAHDLVFFSQVHFNSGYVLEDLAAVVRAVPSDAVPIVIDGYHGFAALPVDLGPIADRAFYLAGGYKYAMAGEGCCFAHCPPGHALRPVNTGWFAGFGALEDGVSQRVGYATDAMRLMGATFDPTALFRLDAVWSHFQREGIDVATIHDHVVALQGIMLEALAGDAIGPLSLESLVPGPAVERRGHFLTFEVAAAAEVHDRLREVGVWTDHRGRRLRFGFAPYHDPEDVRTLLERLRNVLGS